MPDPFTLQETAAAAEATIRARRMMDLPVPWQDEIVYPHYDGYSIYNLAQSIAANFGVPATSPLDAALWPQTTFDRIVFFLTDGLGYKLLNQLSADEDLRATLADLSDGRGPVPLTSISPSTTATALPTLWTAAPPAQHGMMGTHMFLRDFAMLGDMLRFSPSVSKNAQGIFAEWGLNAEDFIPLPAMGTMLSDAGVETHQLLQHDLVKSGLSLLLHRGIQHFHPHVGFRDMWLRLRGLLHDTVGKRAFISVYWPAVDALSHAYGVRSPFVVDEVKFQLNALRDVLNDTNGHDGRTLVVICADHGHYNAPTTIHVDQDRDTQPIHQAMRLPFGAESRFAYLYLRSGQRQRIINTLSRDFADRLAWMEPEAAIEAGLFGPGAPHPDLLHRIGDLIVIPRLGTRLADSRYPDRAVSVHGGLADWEMLVPLMWKQI